MICAGIVCSCTMSENTVFNFPLATVDFPKEAVSLVPGKMSDIGFDLQNFKVYDSLLVEYNSSKSYGLSVLNINSGDTLVNLCRKGRGPDETYFIAPYYDIVDGVARIVDCMNSRYSEIDLYESIKKGNTSFLSHSSFGNPGLNLYYSTRLVGADSLLCYESEMDLRSNTVSALPSYSLFDLKDGNCVAGYDIFRNSAYKRLKKELSSNRGLLTFRDCLIPEHHKVFLSFYHFPVVAFLDYRVGTFSGFKINGLPKYDSKDDFLYFGQCNYSDAIFILYHGVPSSDVAPNGENGSVRSKILKMNLDGEIEGCYELDGSYYEFQISDSTMYLLKSTDSSHLYTLEMDKFN